MSVVKPILSFWLAFICTPCALLFSQEQNISIAGAKAAFNHFELTESMDIFSKVAASATASKKDKVEALQSLGMQWWTFFHDYTKSSRQLKVALALGADKSKTYVLYSQVNAGSFNFLTAYRYADSAIKEGVGETAEAIAFLQKAQVIYDENIYGLKKGIAPSRQKLRIATLLLKRVLQKQPGDPVPAELLTGIALLNKNGKDLLDAWKAYYFIGDGDNINRVLRPSFTVLRSILPGWKDRSLTTEERIKLAKALAASNFYDHAALLATGKIFGKPLSPEMLRDSGIDKILAFHEFIEGIKNVNDAYYPKIARGLKNYDSAYTKEVTRVAGKLWVQLGVQNSIANYNEELFFEQVKEKYGALGYRGNSNGYFSMLLGMIIHDEVKEVNQYGYKATFRYVSISRLISKDFTTWYGAANVGGWGTDSAMIQVRDAYLQAPFERLRWVTDLPARERVVQQIAAARANDLVNCRKDKYAEPTHLLASLRLKASEYLYDSLQKQGLKGEALAMAFIAETLRLNVESTVFGHEGRHAIDQLLFKKEFDAMQDDERELRAKYAEIVFSAAPKLAHTGSFLGGNLDTTTAHGKANYRLRKIFVDWMEVHANEIKGLDKNVPLIMQLDLLTDEQVVAICKEADPLAHKALQ